MSGWQDDADQAIWSNGISKNDISEPALHARIEKYERRTDCGSLISGHSYLPTLGRPSPSARWVDLVRPPPSFLRNWIELSSQVLPTQLLSDAASKLLVYHGMGSHAFASVVT